MGRNVKKPVRRRGAKRQCMLATEASIYMALEQNGYQPDVTAGLSLGEYGALIASGVMTAEEAFELVRKRGIFMHAKERSPKCSTNRKNINQVDKETKF